MSDDKKPVQKDDPLAEFANSGANRKQTRSPVVRSLSLKDKGAILKATPVKRMPVPNLSKASHAPAPSQIPTGPTTPVVSNRPVARRRSEPAWKNKTVFIPSDIPAELKNSDLPGIQKKKQYRKEDIAPTSVQMGIDALNPVHPLTVPFLKISEQSSVRHGLSEVAGMDVEEDTVVGDVYQSQVQRIQNKYTKKIVKTDLAENLFKDSTGAFHGEGELIFVQLPSMLPITPQAKVETPVAPSADGIPPPLKRVWDDEFLGNLKDIPGGRMGKISVYKSGRVKWTIGDVTYDVSEGMPCGFFQELAAIDVPASNYTALGEVNKRMVVSLDINSLVQKEKKKDEGGLLDLDFV